MICGEPNLLGETCGGRVSATPDGDWVYFKCDRCGLERTKHAHTADPQRKRQSRIEQAEIPARFLGQPFEQDEDNKSTLYAAKAWLADYAKGDGLPAPALHGNAGRGKTHLLAALCVKLIRECDASVWFRSARSLLRDLQDFDGEAERAWKRAVSVDVLALDDLGAQQMTDWKHDQISDLVDARYEAELPIVVATNFPPKAWAQAMDKRTASRLAGMTFSLELRGPDRRQLTVQSTAERGT